MCPVQLGKNFHFLLLRERSYFRQIVANTAEDRAVTQCDFLPPSAIALCTIFRTKDGKELLLIQAGRAKFRKLQPEVSFRLPLGTGEHLPRWRARAPDSAR